MFEKLRKAGLKLKPSKCNFFKEQINFLGHIVSKEGISTCPQKVQAVQDWPIPETIHDVQSFLGFVGYYRKFIQGFSSIAKLLYSLYEGLENTKQANRRQTIKWGSEQQEAFDTLKRSCVSAPILGYPIIGKPFILHTDASLNGLGAVLYQKDQEGKIRVIAYASRSLSNQNNWQEIKFCELEVFLLLRTLLFWLLHVPATRMMMSFLQHHITSHRYRCLATLFLL